MTITDAVVDVLECDDAPEEVAGAARALRGRRVPPPRIAASLQRALDNRDGVDAPVALPGSPPSTVLTELVRALGAVAAHDPVALDVLDDLALEPWTAGSAALIREIRRARKPRRRAAGGSAVAVPAPRGR